MKANRIYRFLQSRIWGVFWVFKHRRN